MITPSWLMSDRMVPTTSAIRIVLRSVVRRKTTWSASRGVDHAGRVASAVAAMSGAVVAR
jgi:predicted deacetylase